jgi:hypothetical protein
MATHGESVLCSNVEPFEYLCYCGRLAASFPMGKEQSVPLVRRLQGLAGQ